MKREFLLALAAAGALLSSWPSNASTVTSQAMTPESRPGNPVQDIDVQEHLGQLVSPDLTFVDSTGKSVKLGDYFDGEHPVLLNLVYFRCPMLCNLVLAGVFDSVRKTGFDMGIDYRSVTVSIDPSDGPKDAASKRTEYLRKFDRPIESNQFGFLTGKQEEIDALARTVGFKYAYDPQTQQFAHDAVTFVLSPQGKITRYLYGVDFAPRDIKLALLEASEGRVGTSFDRVLLKCYKYDPAQRRYAFFISAYLRTGGLLVFAGLATVLAVLWRREFKRGTIS